MDGEVAVNCYPAVKTESGFWSRLALVIESFFFRHRDRLVWVHMLMFVGFLALIFVPAFLPDPPEDATALTHFIPIRKPAWVNGGYLSI